MNLKFVETIKFEIIKNLYFIFRKFFSYFFKKYYNNKYVITPLVYI